jgi:hypothetical protein
MGARRVVGTNESRSGGNAEQGAGVPPLAPGPAMPRGLTAAASRGSRSK